MTANLPISAADESSSAPHERRRILLLCDDGRGHAETIYESIAALSRTGFRTYKVNPRGVEIASQLRLSDYAAVIIHWTLVTTADHYLSPRWRAAIRAYPGLKIQLIQDDYRWIHRSEAMMRHLGVQVLYTLAAADNIDRIWDPQRTPNVEKRTYLTGYVSPAMENIPTRRPAERPIDVGYRGRTLPYWLGALGQEKVRVGSTFLKRAAGTGLRCDIAWDENSRVYGQSWVDFVASCRACLGTESGSSVVDFDGSIQEQVETYVRANPSSSFEDVSERFLKERDGAIMHNVISPRIFEAASLRTALVLHPGSYSGILEEWRHYIPLEKDFSNFDEVVRLIRDDAFLEQLTERAHADLIASRRYSFEAHTADLESTIRRKLQDSSIATAEPSSESLFSMRRKVEQAVYQPRRMWGLASAYRRRVVRKCQETIDRAPPGFVPASAFVTKTISAEFASRAWPVIRPLLRPLVLALVPASVRRKLRGLPAVSVLPAAELPQRRAA